MAIAILSFRRGNRYSAEEYFLKERMFAKHAA